MKRIAALFTIMMAILLSMVLVAGCQQQNGETEKYSGHGVSFDYPKNWVEVQVTEPEALWTVAFEDTGSDIEPGVVVYAYQMEGMTLREFELAHPWVGTNVNYTTSIVDVVINGRDAIMYSFTAEIYGAQVTGDSIYITKDYEVVYYVECYSLTSEYSASEDAFNTLLNSFTID